MASKRTKKSAGRGKSKSARKGGGRRPQVDDADAPQKSGPTFEDGVAVAACLATIAAFAILLMVKGEFYPS